MSVLEKSPHSGGVTATSMTKSELIEAVAASMRQPKTLVAKTIDLAFQEIARAIHEEERFCMPGFGTFSIRHRKARKGFNPRTNEKMDIPAARTVGFRAAPELKKRSLKLTPGSGSS
jgi:DNA-binding protein HU-beta